MASSNFCVYVLKTVKGNRTYVGKTNDMHRRYRQHIKLLTNGARYTSCIKADNEWIPVAQIIGFHDEKQALQFEYAMKGKMDGYRNKQLSLQKREEIKHIYTTSVKEAHTRACQRIIQLLQCICLPKWTSKAVEARDVHLQIVWYGKHYRPYNMDRLLADLPHVTDMIHDGINGQQVIIYQTNDHVYTKQQLLPVPIKHSEV